MTKPKNVLIYGEIEGGKLSPITMELLGIGRRLADAREEELAVVLIDPKAESCAQDAVAYGADRVVVVKDAPTEHFEGASFTAIIEGLCSETMTPAILLLGQTVRGRDLGPRIAFRLGAGLVTDCIRLDINPETKDLIAIKPVSGGNVLATYQVMNEGMQMATIRRRTWSPSKGTVPAGEKSSPFPQRWMGPLLRPNWWRGSLKNPRARI